MKSFLLKLGVIALLFSLVTGCGGSSSPRAENASAFYGITVDDVNSPTKLYLSNFGSNVISFVAHTGGSASTMVSAYAGLSGPQGMVRVGSNLYVVDALNHAIREVATSSAYTVTTYAGTVGTPGNSDTDGSFYLPRNAVADSAGNLYVTDSGNNTVRKIAAGTKTVTTIASGFNNPWGITIDSDIPQNLYVTDIGTNSVKKVTLAGAVTTFAGNIGGNYGPSTNANGTSAYFKFPLGITTDNNYLYVVDSGNNAVRSISLTPPYAVLLMAGSSAGTSGNTVNSTGTSALFSSPYAITYGNGALYVTDQSGTVIREVSTTSPFGVTALTLN